MCWGAGKGGSLLTVSMLGSPKPPGSNMLVGGMESSLQSAAVVESPSYWSANTTLVTLELH